MHSEEKTLVITVNAMLLGASSKRTCFIWKDPAKCWLFRVKQREKEGLQSKLVENGNKKG
jgi:hypothetical protein